MTKLALVGIFAMGIGSETNQYQMKMERCSPTVPRTGLLLFSTDLMRPGPLEPIGELNCLKERTCEVSCYFTRWHFAILTCHIALALSDSYIVAVTTKDYVRVYTLFGTPYRVYRQKSEAVTCSAWRDYIMTIGNGPVSSDGRSTSLRYTVENVKRDEICQNEDVVALPTGAQLQSVFFSDSGVCT